MSYIQTMMDQACARGGAILAVAAAHDPDVLHAVAAARREGIAKAILTGNPAEITMILQELGENPEDYPILPAETDEECAALAVSCIRAGRANLLMKGILSTSTMMKAVIDKEQGLRTNRLISHIMMYECPSYPRPFYLTDGGMNTFPSLEAKADILENAAAVLQALGYSRINAACICGAEAINPKITSTTDAAALSSMTELWEKYNMQVFGPVGLDLAVSREACRHKKYTAPGAGEADILLVPSYEVGNGIGKAMTYFGNAKSAGIVVGAKVPIVLVSRSDNSETKLAAIALGALIRESGK